MLSRESKVDIISDIIYDYLKGKHKDRIAKELAEQILKELNEYDE
jgi:hypothetical protein